MGQLLSSLLEIFYTKKLDIVVIGLENRYVFVFRHSCRNHSVVGTSLTLVLHSILLHLSSGKTTLLSVLAHGEAVETVPTIGLNVKVFKKGKVNMKCWDIGGQEQYRSEWSRYTKGCDVVLYVVDAAAPQKMAMAKKELHKLLDDGSIGSTPMLVLANKIDLPDHVGESELIEKLQLNYVMETPWMVLPISAMQCTNVDQVVEWLTAQGK
jgi:ADP-ribosylation factor-like protein 8